MCSPSNGHPSCWSLLRMVVPGLVRDTTCKASVSLTLAVVVLCCTGDAADSLFTLAQFEQPPFKLSNCVQQIESFQHQ